MTREKRRQSKYGLTVEAISALLDQQNGECPICQRAIIEATCHVDHDHSCCSAGNRKTCGKCVRGLLCVPCNTGIGRFYDRPDLLESAANYLRLSALDRS